MQKLFKRQNFILFLKSITVFNNAILEIHNTRKNALFFFSKPSFFIEHLIMKEEFIGKKKSIRINNMEVKEKKLLLKKSHTYSKT